MADQKFISSLIAGGLAGIAVDVSLFPLDTIKTRLQSRQGFWRSGGFSRIYSGIGPAAVGSAPNSALFFCTYDTVKRTAQSHYGMVDGPKLHMAAASLGEVVACLVRVPVEIVKQRRQAHSSLTSLEIVRSSLAHEGIGGLYRGYLTTLFREIPFSLIQFPLWELFKKKVTSLQDRDCLPWESSLCGAVAGALAAGLTTPLDVAKTRIMLAQVGSSDSRLGLLSVIQLILKEKGMKGLFAGVIPRVTWISLGGGIFFGVYEKVKSLLH